MKLRDLEAVLVRHVDGMRFTRDDASVSECDGVLFVCPGCGNHSILVWFAGRAIPAELEPRPRWQASGTRLDDLTLTPSINLDTESARQHGTCRWHGWVRNGDAA